VDGSEFFDEIEGQQKAYWYGFVCADGCVYRSGKQFALTLGTRDQDHLEKFAAIFDRPVWRSAVVDRRTGKTYARARCILNSKHLCSALRRSGFQDGARPFESVAQPDLHHFIRGYFDGDGHIGVVRETQWRVAFVGDGEFLRALRDRVCARLGLRVTAVRRDKNIHRLGWGGTWQLARLRDFLYADAATWLERKKELFDRMPAQRGSSRYIGVYRPNGRDRWVARIYVNGKTRHIASCQSEEEAARAYDAAARLYYGARAVLNFPSVCSL
jgi:hypothetical protein